MLRRWRSTPQASQGRMAAAPVGAKAKAADAAAGD
jgi:hypothetical protein